MLVPHICLSTCINAAPSGWIFMKFESGAFMKICQESPDLSNSVNDFVAQRYCRVNPSLFFHCNTEEYFYIFGDYI